jgi:hypothetical protein
MKEVYDSAHPRAGSPAIPHPAMPPDNGMYPAKAG